MSRQKKLKLIKKVWLAFFIIMILNNVIGETVLAFAQTSAPNPFLQYLPELIPLGYLIAGVLFMLGLIAYRKDYSYAILLISAGALVAGLLNYGVGNAYGVNENISVTEFPLLVGVYCQTQQGPGLITDALAQPGFPTFDGIGYINAPEGKEFCVVIKPASSHYQLPPLNDFNITWYIGNTQLPISFQQNGNEYIYKGQLSTAMAGTNTIIVTLTYVQGHTLYYDYLYVEFRYIPTAGSIYTDVMDALMVVSGIGAFASGYFGTQVLTGSISDAICDFIHTPTLGGSGANGDAEHFYSYFESIAKTLGFILIALGIGINALRGGYSDMVDLGMDFFYRSGIFLLFTYGGEQIFNAVANSLNMISQSIINSMIGQIASTLAIWTELAVGLIVGSNFIGFGFGRALTDFAMFLLEVDIAIFSVAYIRVVLILALASLIPLLVAMWTFEWTRGIALAIAEVLAGLVFGGLIDALLLYFMVQVGGFAFFLFAPIGILAMLMTGFGAHQIAKSVGLSVASKSTPSIPTISTGSKPSGSQNSGGQGSGGQGQQNVPITQVIPPSSSQPQNAPPQQLPQSNIPTANIPTTPSSPSQIGGSPQTSLLQPTQKAQGFASPQTTTNPTSVPIQQAMQQLGTVSAIRLNNGNRYATVRAVQGGYQITKGIKTDQGAVEKTYNIPGYASIEEVASGVRKNFVNKGQTEINPELIGSFFKSLESNNTPSTENVKTTNLR